jgi:hypothetical protein
MPALRLLVLLAGCAAQPRRVGSQWYGQHGPAAALDSSRTVSAGQDAVDVDFEVPAPQQAEALRQRGVNLQRVGTNRPDLQFDYRGRRYHVEYDSPSSGRGPGHQSRITSNDSDAEVILIIVP